MTLQQCYNDLPGILEIIVKHIYIYNKLLEIT